MEFEDCVVHEIGGQLKLQSSLRCSASVCVLTIKDSASQGFGNSLSFDHKEEPKQERENTATFAGDLLELEKSFEKLNTSTVNCNAYLLLSSFS